eukprot:sb/3466046/
MSHSCMHLWLIDSMSHSCMSHSCRATVVTMVTDNTEEDAADKQEDDDTFHLDGKPENETHWPEDERTPLKNKTDPTSLTQLRKVLLIAFAFTGNVVFMTVYGYPSGFLLEYLTDKGINESIGTIAVAMSQLFTIVGPILTTKFPAFNRIPITYRACLLCLTGALCSASLSVLDYIHNKTAVLFLLSISRALLGIVMGIFFVIVQGEIVDLYFKTSRTPVLLISSGIYLGNVIGALLGVELYLCGGWVLTALGMAFINLLPCVFLACLDIRSNTKEDAVKEEECCCMSLRRKELSLGQNAAYYGPDFAFFMINVFFACLLYAAPYRELLYDDVALDTTEYLMNIATVIAMVIGTLVTLG